MCVVVQRYLGKGDAALSPCTPQAMAFLLHRASSGHKTVSPVKHSRGAFGAPLHPIDQGGYRTPLKPTRRRLAAASPIRGAFLLPPMPPRQFHGDRKGSDSTLPLPWTHPIDLGRSAPRPQPTRAALDAQIMLRYRDSTCRFDF